MSINHLVLSSSLRYWQKRGWGFKVLNNKVKDDQSNVVHLRLSSLGTGLFSSNARLSLSSSLSPKLISFSRLALKLKSYANRFSDEFFFPLNTIKSAVFYLDPNRRSSGVWPSMFPGIDPRAYPYLLFLTGFAFLGDLLKNRLEPSFLPPREAFSWLWSFRSSGPLSG